MEMLRVSYYFIQGVCLENVIHRDTLNTYKIRYIRHVHLESYKKEKSSNSDA